MVLTELLSITEKNARRPQNGAGIDVRDGVQVRDPTRLIWRGRYERTDGLAWMRRAQWDRVPLERTGTELRPWTPRIADCYRRVARQPGYRSATAEKPSAWPSPVGEPRSEA